MTGYKIDFELEQEAKFLPKLRSILHLGFKWLLERDKLIIGSSLCAYFMII